MFRVGKQTVYTEGSEGHQPKHFLRGRAGRDIKCRTSAAPLSISSEILLQVSSLACFSMSLGVLETLVPTGTAAQAMRILQNMEGIQHCKGQAMPGQDGMQR